MEVVREYSLNHIIRSTIYSVAIMLILISTLFAYTYNSSKDSVFADPLQKPKEVERLVYVRNSASNSFGALSYMDAGGTNSYEVKKVIERELNITLVYPFGRIETLNNGIKYDADDLYLVSNYDTSKLVKCGKNATSINDIYNCTIKFNADLYKKKQGNCRTSTSAFKIAFMNSPLAANNSGANFKLMKAFVKGAGYNAHRFIVLSNRNGNFVIDPYWGQNEDLSTAVKKYSNSFYNETNASNYRYLVYKVDYFYGS
jgi:hypothetical protein